MLWVQNTVDALSFLFLKKIIAAKLSVEFLRHLKEIILPS